MSARAHRDLLDQLHRGERGGDGGRDVEVGLDFEHLLFHLVAAGRGQLEVLAPESASGLDEVDDGVFELVLGELDRLQTLRLVDHRVFDHLLEGLDRRFRRQDVCSGQATGAEVFVDFEAQLLFDDLVDDVLGGQLDQEGFREQQRHVQHELVGRGVLGLVAQLERLGEALVFPEELVGGVCALAVGRVVLDHGGDVEVEEFLGESRVR